MPTTRHVHGTNLATPEMIGPQAIRKRWELNVGTNIEKTHGVQEHWTASEFPAYQPTAGKDTKLYSALKSGLWIGKWYSRLAA